MVERLAYNEKVSGSSPLLPSLRKNPVIVDVVTIIGKQDIVFGEVDR